MISVNQGIGTSVPENWITFRINWGDLKVARGRGVVVGKNISEEGDGTN